MNQMIRFWENDTLVVQGQDQIERKFYQNEYSPPFYETVVSFMGLVLLYLDFKRDAFNVKKN